jgi:hypothetical protein
MPPPKNNICISRIIASRPHSPSSHAAMRYKDGERFYPRMRRLRPLSVTGPQPRHICERQHSRYDTDTKWGGVCYVNRRKQDLARPPCPAVGHVVVTDHRCLEMSCPLHRVAPARSNTTQTTVCALRRLSRKRGTYGEIQTASGTPKCAGYDGLTRKRPSSLAD